MVRGISILGALLALFAFGAKPAEVESVAVPAAAAMCVPSPFTTVVECTPATVPVEECVPASVQVEQDDYETARQLAMQTERPLFVMVKADGCLPCAMMERDTIKPMLAAGEFDNALLVRVNMSRSPELAASLAVTAAPTLLVFQFKDGAWGKSRKVVGNVGRETVSKMLGFVRGTIKKAAKVATAPIRAVSAVRDNYRARWQNYDGLSGEEHARVYHGIDTRGLTPAQIARMRDADHDRYGPGHPPAMRNRNASARVSVASCPTCPTSFSSYGAVSYSGKQRTTGNTRTSSCPGGVCPQQTRRGLFARWR